ncbi:MAG: hypothetical protein K2L97_00110 [Muribaculaceae bacterium]|nr:hypothetical protein [Muribaculaceae bacterium]
MKRSLLTAFILGLLSTLCGVSAATSVSDTDSVLFIIQRPTLSKEIPVARKSELGHFTWGADLGSAIDLTANDMSSIDISAYLGYKGSWVRFAGIGAGITSMISNASRCYPIFAMLRTSFSTRPQLCFLDLRLGLSVNNILEYQSQTDFFGSLGIGITLAKGSKFSSHLIVSYNFMPIRPYTVYTQVTDTEVRGEQFEDHPQEPQIIATRQRFPDLHFAAIRIGCSF